MHSFWRVAGLLSAVVLGTSSAHAWVPISNGKAAEFALHRIERLVILHQLDATYQTRFQRLDLTLKTPQAPTDPMFVIVASEVPGEDGTRMTVQLGFDPIGRPLSQLASPGAASINAPQWPLKDAVTIAENSLHWLQDEGAKLDEVKPFLNLMSSLELEPVLDSQGALASARVTLRISEDAPVLRVALGLDGVFAGYEVVPALPVLQPSYASLRRLILEPRCAKCHAPGQEVERIPLMDLQELLDSPRELVLPGDVPDSGLWIALTRTDDKRMPPPAEGPPLSEEELQVVARWITEGAKP